MPPKRTPSKETATADPQIGQVLEMLQTMSAQIKRLGERIGAVEKKSEAALEAVDAIKKVDKEVSPRKATDRARENQKEVRRRAKPVGSRYPAESSRGEEEDEEIISRGEHVVTKIGAHVKTVLTIMGSKKSSTKKAEQAYYVESLKVAFETTMNGQIVSRNPRVWEVFADEEKNGDEVFVQERVMISVLQATLKAGTPAKTKYNLAKRKDERDGRAMYVAVRDANQLSTSKLSKRQVKRKIKGATFEKNDNYDDFIDKMEYLFEDLADLKDEATGESLALLEEDKVEIVIEKLVESDPTWQDILDSATTSFEQAGNEFNMEDLHARVAQRLDLADATGINEKGKVHSQQEEPKKNRKQVICFKCNKEGHMAWKCPENKTQEVASKNLCRNYQKGKCTRRDKCHFKHEKQRDEDEDEDYQSFLRFKKFKEKAEEGKGAKQTAYWPVEEEPQPWEQKAPRGE